jgi:hypothetical protein
MSLSTAEWRGNGERRVLVDGDRVACWRIGSVALARCQECSYLLRLEVAGNPPTWHVVCAHSDVDTEFEFAW